MVQPTAQQQRKRHKFSPVERAAVLVRDGGRCTYCGGDLLDAPAHLDHVVAFSRGGSDDLAGNIVLSCPPCNRSKAARLLSDWRPEAIAAVVAALAEPLDMDYAAAYVKVRKG